MGSSANWNADTAQFLTLYKYILGIIGLWVLDEKNVFSRIRWFVSTIVEMSTTVFASVEIIKNCKGYEDTMDAFLIGSSSIVSISKLFLHRVNWRYKLFLVEAIIHDWTYVKNPSYSRDIMLKYARIGKAGASTFLSFGVISCMSYIIILVFYNVDLSWISERLMYNRTDEWKLILAAYCVFEKYISSVQVYSFIEAIQILQVSVNCISQCGNDGFFFHLTMHVCGQFEVLKTDFSEISDDGMILHDKIDVLLKRHCRLICLADYLEKAFSTVILMQVFMSVVVLCIEGFQVIVAININNIVNATKHMVYMIVLLIQLFIYCFAGQILEKQSEELAYAIYNSPWYNFDVSVIRNLSFVILRTNKPHQLTAGKFLAINFMSFKEILKASASYLSVLRVMLET